MSNTLRCPRSNNIVPGHYMNQMNPLDIPKTAVPVTILLNKDNQSLVTILDKMGDKAKETWFFHNAIQFRINISLEALADYMEKIIYTRSLGENNYRTFLCSSQWDILTCPDDELSVPEKAKHSFLENLGYKAKPKTIAPTKTSTYKDGDYLVTVTVTNTPTRNLQIPKRPNRPIGKQPAWVNHNEATKVKGVDIGLGLIYIGQPDTRQSDWDLSPAIINLNSPVNLSRPDHSGGEVGYWPSYTRLSPEARAGYLLWLAGKRDNPKASISFVFLYFFGLERRVIIDARRDTKALGDLPGIRAEIVRLRSIYGEHKSFNKYSEGLIHLIDLMLNPEMEDTLIGNNQDKDGHPWWLRIKLASYAKRQISMPADLALTWVRTHPTIKIPKPGVRCSEEFDTLFHTKYRDKYGFGMPLPEFKQKLIFRYKPATAGMDIVVLDTHLPDITRSVKINNALNVIVQECSSELNRYSLLLGREPEAKGSYKALILLPEILLSEEQKEFMELEKSKRVKVKKKDSKVLPSENVIRRTPVVLDPHKIVLKEMETKQVSQLLHSILAEETEKTSEPATSIDSNSPSFPGETVSVLDNTLGLDEPHWSLLKVLSTKESWSRADYILECKKLDLMPNGALDLLNEAFINCLGTELTDGEDPIEVNSMILREIME